MCVGGEGVCVWPCPGMNCWRPSSHSVHVLEVSICETEVEEKMGEKTEGKVEAGGAVPFPNRELSYCASFLCSVLTYQVSALACSPWLVILAKVCW